MAHPQQNDKQEYETHPKQLQAKDKWSFKARF
jgi:hypothetical protein